MGKNMALENAYYCLNPFNILFLLFGSEYDNLLAAVIVIVKTGLASLAFSFYSMKMYKVKGQYAAFVGLLYSVCSFQIAYNVTNIAWLDAMWLLPMICLSISELSNVKGCIGLLLLFS